MVVVLGGLVWGLDGTGCAGRVETSGRWVGVWMDEWLLCWDCCAGMVGLGL